MRTNQAQQTNLLKKHLFEKFGIQCRIKTSIYTLNVYYKCGCAIEELECYLKNLQYGTFDSMTDCQGIKKSSEYGLTIDGVVLNTFQYVFVEREMPESLRFELAKAFSKLHKFADLHPCEQLEDFKKPFKEFSFGAWSWRDLIKTRHQNFCTQDENQIKIIEAFKSDKGFDLFEKVGYVYEVNGIEYKTTESAKPQTKKEAEKAIEPLHTKGIRLVDYSEKAIALYGDTKPLKEVLRAFGGRFNAHLRDGAGWVFSKDKEAVLRKTLSL